MTTEEQSKDDLGPVTKELYLVANYASTDSSFYVTIDNWKPAQSSECFLLYTFKVERGTDLTHDELVEMQLAQLDVKDRALAAAYHMDKKDVEETRQSLLAITHQPQEDPTDTTPPPEAGYEAANDPEYEGGQP